MNEKTILLCLFVFMIILGLNTALSALIAGYISLEADRNHGVREDTGRQITIDLNDVCFNMRLAPAAVFPRRSNDKGQGAVENDFWVGETPITYGQGLQHPALGF